MENEKAMKKCYITKKLKEKNKNKDVYLSAWTLFDHEKCRNSRCLLLEKSQYVEDSYNCPVHMLSKHF